MIRLPRRLLRVLPKKLARKYVCASIRENMLFFGYDLSHLTDEEMEERVAEGAKVIASTGFTTKEAAEAMRRLLQVVDAAERKRYNSCQG